jgi:2-keto-4-pentenoate hydratase
VTAAEPTTCADDLVARAVERLITASETGIACAPVRDLIGPDDIDAAYRVQQTVIARRAAAGSKLVGRKIGLTSAAVQQQVGVDRPDFGVLLDDMRLASDSVIPFRRLLQPRAEAEVAFVLGRSLDGPTDSTSVRAAVRCAVAAIEVVDSRIENWQIAIADTVADNASSGVFVLSSQEIPLSAFAPADVSMKMRRNGELVSAGNGQACLGDPLNALAWLARTAIDIGHPLSVGDIVLSGALGPMVPVHPGDVFTADIGPLGSVTARFGQANPAMAL